MDERVNARNERLRRVNIKKEEWRVKRLTHWAKQQDDFFPFQEWPEWVQQLFLKKHRNNNERYNFAYFLAGNGMDPRKAGWWALSYDVGPEGLMVEPTQYDEAAMAQMLDQFPKEYDTRQHKKVYLIDEKRVI